MTNNPSRKQFENEFPLFDLAMRDDGIGYVQPESERAYKVFCGGYQAAICAVMQWRGIESAPRDGSSMLLYYTNSCGKGRIIKAMYVPRFTEESDNDNSEYCEERDQYYTREGWYEICDNWDEYSHFMVNQGNKPTHWMPLPSAPTPPSETDNEER